MSDTKTSATANAYVRQLPELTQENREFWTGGQAGELRISHCPECSHYTHPPSPICPNCLCRKMRPAAVSGRGKIITFTVNRHRWVPTMPVPFVLAHVEIEEQPGVWLFTQIIECEPEEVRIGMKVRVVFEHIEDVWLPMFVKDAA